MIVFRVEDQEGTGAYHKASARGLDSSPSTNRPMAYDDGLNHHYDGGYIFGFESLSSFLRWFDDEREHQLLEDHGYFISEYEVPEQQVERGRCQLVFKKESATIICTHDLTSNNNLLHCNLTD